MQDVLLWLSIISGSLLSIMRLLLLLCCGSVGCISLCWAMWGSGLPYCCMGCLLGGSSELFLLRRVIVISIWSIMESLYSRFVCLLLWGYYLAYSCSLSLSLVTSILEYLLLLYSPCCYKTVSSS